MEEVAFSVPAADSLGTPFPIQRPRLGTGKGFQFERAPESRQPMGKQTPFGVWLAVALGKSRNDLTGQSK